MKKYLSFIIILIVVFGSSLALLLFSGGNSQYLPEKDEGYVIEQYTIDIIVNDDKSMDITENITANFLEPSHGITRYLALTDQVSYYNNGKLEKKNYSNKISNFKYNYAQSSLNTALVDEEVSSGYQFYYLGNSYQYVTGQQTYNFSYTFDLGDDRIKNKDLFYFNVIGTGWNTDIENVDFTVTFPNEITAQEFDFYVGQYGEDNVGSGRVNYHISGNTLTGDCAGLQYGEAITVYTEFADGYFDCRQSLVFDFLILGVFIALIVGLIVFFVLKRRKDPIVEVVEFSPPNGLTPTEAGYINDGKLTGDDISSLIVYWAAQGYVKLTDKKKSVDITKVKELPESSKLHEKLFFKGLFASGTTVNSNTLSNFNGNTGYKCKQSVENSTKKCFDAKIDTIFNVFIFLTIALFGGILIKNYLQAVARGWSIFIGIIMIIVLIVGLLLIPNIYKLKDKEKKGKFVLFLALDSLLILGAIITLSFFIESYSDALFARFYVMLLPLAMIIIYPFLERYTAVGREYLGKIRGLKNFIMVAEKDRMEMMVKEDPALFYNVLPYAYVLGVSDVFMTKFKDVNIAQPDWFVCDSFTTAYLTICMVRNMNVMSSVIAQKFIHHNITKVASTVASTVGHSGGSRGGGFSGGGSGGGGGGRW